MSRKKSILQQELSGIPVDEMVLEATAGDGASHRATHVYVGSMPLVLIIAIGPAAEYWESVVNGYHAAMAAEAGAQSPGGSNEG